MRLRAIVPIVVLAICGVMAVAATAADRTPTKVTIKALPGGDYAGQVKSDKPRCADGRTVYLYKLLGERPKPKNDQLIAMDTSEKDGSKYRWSTGNTGQRKGKFYAKVRKTDKCGGDISDVVRAME